MIVFRMVSDVQYENTEIEEDLESSGDDESNSDDFRKSLDFGKYKPSHEFSKYLIIYFVDV